MPKKTHFYIFSIISTSFLFFQVSSAHQEEICGNFNGRRMYVELGKKGTLIAKNLGSLKNISQKADSYKQCRFELTSCPACVVSLKFTFLNVSQGCNKSSVLNACTCDYVLVYDPPFHEISRHQFCGYYANDSLLSYRSQTRTAMVIFFYTNSYERAFILEYASERNRQVIQGMPGNENISPIISSPFFPNHYLRDLSIEYVIHCNGSEDCRISLTFTDFLLAKMSVIEFFDWNGRRLNAVTGTTFRPPTIISSGPSLNIRFYANGATNKGFKIDYKFISSDNYNNKSVLTSKMDCGGLVDNMGGGITMMNAVTEITQFDCVWIVQPSKNFVHFYKHLYLKVVAFSNFGGNTELSIHEGQTSSGARIVHLKYPLDALKQTQHTIQISEGFYLRFRGVLQGESKLGIAYTAFGYTKCIPGTDFLCKNQRCIPIYLQCDGFDHCGDNSDELSSCFQDLKHHRWSHSSNFFFPKTDNYSVLNTEALVFIMCCFGMISLILALIILIFRTNGRARHQREVENHLQAISELLDQDTLSIQAEILEGDEPPGYEEPPTYDDVDNRKNEISGKQTSSRSTARQESIQSRNFNRRTCRRCSQQLSKAKSTNRSNLRRAEESNNKIVTNTNFQIPDSPPPAYLQYLPPPIIEMTNIFAATSSNNNNYRLIENFSIDDFASVKKRAQQKIKKRKVLKIGRARKFFPNLSQSAMSHCLSDSELSEINIDNFEDDSFKIQRSFSFDDL